MSVVTYRGHTKRAIKWFKEENVYLAIGKTSAWVDESAPPYPKPEDTIQEVVFYKQVEQKYYVIQSDDGTVFYRGQKYKILTEQEARDQNCRWVFCASWLNYDEAPTNIGYRQVGLFSDLVRKEGVPVGKYSLYPEEVSSPGDLECLANDTVTMRSANKRERLAMLIEF